MELPFNIIEIKDYPYTFELNFLNYKEVEKNDLIGEFAIKFDDHTVSADFICDLTIGNVYEFYKELVNVYNNNYGTATLEDYSNRTSFFKIEFYDKVGHLIIEGKFSNHNGTYFGFGLQSDQSYLKKWIDNLSVMFSELIKIQGNDDFV